VLPPELGKILKFMVLFSCPRHQHSESKSNLLSRDNFALGKSRNFVLHKMRVLDILST
jgi:hypothetical protein